MSPVEKFVYLAWALYLLITVPWVWSFVGNAKAQRRRGAWPRVSGTVIDHRLESDGRGYYLDEMRLQYEFAGAPYERWLSGADRRRMAPKSAMMVDALLEKMKKRHPAGSVHDVIVNPANPNEAYLYRREWSDTVFLGVVVALVGGFFAIFVYIGLQFIG